MPTPTSDPELFTKLEYDTDPELELLGSELIQGGMHSSAHEGLKNAPIFTGDAFRVLDVFPQRALYGRIMAQECKGFPATVTSPKLYINTNTPFSALTCGVQGSGKSHSTSVLLESCLIRDDRLGTLPAPLSALLFHFDSASGGGHLQPCEAAYLASLDKTRGGNAKPPKVTVLVMPSTLRAMKKVYAALPHVSVEALHFAEEDMSGERLLAMMKVDQEQHMPLYMECIMDILRAMEDTFNYEQFRQQLSQQKFSPPQKAMLDLRLKLLDSCLQGGTTSNRVSKHFNQGQLTIIDLSSPFMDGSSACGFFEIILGLFIEAKTEASGKIVVLDEAHKYLTNSGSSSRLTDSLLSVIRQQRHLATRVVISTQEPTVVPATFLDLCSFVIAHRFSSPRWLDHLKQHISVVDAQSFSRAFTLKTGEAMIFAPAGVGLRDNPKAQGGVHTEGRICAPFGPGYLLVRSRERITQDGGRSLLAVPVPPSCPSQPISHTRDEAWRTLTTTVEFTRPYQGSSVVSTSSDYTSDSADTQALPRPEDLKHKPVMKTDDSTKLGKVTPCPSIAPANGPPKNAANVDVRETPVCLPDVNPRFRPLINALKGQGRVLWTAIGATLRKRSPPPYEGKLGAYLKLAADAKIVEIGNVTSPAGQWVQLPTEPDPPPVVEIPDQFKPLVETLKSFSKQGDIHPRRSDVAIKLKKDYPTAPIGIFKSYVRAAKDASVIKCDTAQDRISLA